MKQIERKTYSVQCKGEPIEVKFVFAELPNDMKMIAFLAGELTNSATYFSTFADVNTSNLVNVKGTYDSKPTNTWKPWVYSKRVKDAKAVEIFKQNLNPKLTSKTNRSNFFHC